MSKTLGELLEGKTLPVRVKKTTYCVGDEIFIDWFEVHYFYEDMAMGHFSTIKPGRIKLKDKGFEILGVKKPRLLAFRYLALNNKQLPCGTIRLIKEDEMISVLDYDPMTWERCEWLDEPGEQ